MKTLNKFITVLGLACALAFVPETKAAPGTGPYTFGITNATLAASIGETASQFGLSISNGVNNLQYNDSCYLVFECDTVLSNKLGTAFPLATVTLQRVVTTLKQDNGTSPIVWVPQAPNLAGADFATPIGGHICVTSNLANTVVGAISGLALVNFTNLNSCGSITNISLRLEFKNKIAP